MVFSFCSLLGKLEYPKDNHRSVISHCQTLSHTTVLSTSLHDVRSDIPKLLLTKIRMLQKYEIFAASD